MNLAPLMAIAWFLAVVFICGLFYLSKECVRHSIRLWKTGWPVTGSLLAVAGAGFVAAAMYCISRIVTVW